MKQWKDIVKDQESGCNIEIKKFTNNLTFDIICDTAFGYQAKSQITSSQFSKTFRKAINAVSSAKARVIRKYLPFVKYLPFGLDSVTTNEADDILFDVSILLFQVKKISF